MFSLDEIRPSPSRLLAIEPSAARQICETQWSGIEVRKQLKTARVSSGTQLDLSQWRLGTRECRN